MTTTTLVLTRKPNDLYKAPNGKEGRFGTLIVLQGPKIEKIDTTPLTMSTEGVAPILASFGAALTFTLSGPGTVKEVKRYTTIERMGGFVQLKPQKYIHNKAYRLTYEEGNSAVIKLSGTGGKCFRVHGGISAPEQGILIHAAPQVGWLIGCIGPRRLGDKNKGDTQSTFAAMNELFALSPRPSELFVLDW